MTDQHKQPRALYMLFFAEMWERFSFYGMRALLTLYLVSELFKDLGDDAQGVAYGIYAAYGALVYATPFLGGLVADKILGFKRSVMFGAVLMTIGHLVMAVENETALYIALAFLIAGNGFFKPNISSMVGGLYTDINDPRRDGGFTIFYMGINLGAGLAPLVCGYLGETYGWAYGFGLAGIGMLAGLVVFGMGQGQLGENGDPPNPEKLKAPMVGPLTQEWLVYIGGFVTLFALLIEHYELMSYVLTPFAVLVLGVIVVTAIQSEKIVRERLFVVIVLLVFSTLFWAFFEQAGSSITLFTANHVDRAGIPASIFQSVNPIFILLFAVPFSALWTKLGEMDKDPSAPVKFGIGILQLGLGFLILGASAGFISLQEREVDGATVVAAVTPVAFLLLGYLLHTTGELCLSPVGLSAVTKLAPKKIMAMVMGAWFLSSAMAHHIGGIIALLTSPPDTDAAPGQLAIESGILESAGDLQEATLASYDALANYVAVFKQLGMIAVGAGVLCLVLAPVLKRWMHIEDEASSPAAAPATEGEDPATF